MPRLEHDFLGEMRIPSDTYYGIQTYRAVENFPISGVSIASFPELIKALGLVKKASAIANMQFGVLPREIGDAICAACDEIIEGKLHDQFPVDCIQGGAGTSTNMNANEVIANRALELLGHKKGEYEYCHPNNHVNCSQSTNDVYPTALQHRPVYHARPADRRYGLSPAGIRGQVRRVCRTSSRWAAHSCRTRCP